MSVPGCVTMMITIVYVDDDDDDEEEVWEGNMQIINHGSVNYKVTYRVSLI